MNIVLGDAVEEVSGAEQNRIGMVVSFFKINFLRNFAASQNFNIIANNRHVISSP
jgi:uncharacterized protein (DUF1330 family)